MARRKEKIRFHNVYINKHIYSVFNIQFVKNQLYSVYKTYFVNNFLMNNVRQSKSLTQDHYFVQRILRSMYIGLSLLIGIFILT